MATPCCLKHSHHRRPTQGLCGGKTLGIAASRPNAHPTSIYPCVCHKPCFRGPKDTLTMSRPFTTTVHNSSKLSVAILMFRDIFWVMQSKPGQQNLVKRWVSQWWTCWKQGRPRWRLGRRLKPKMMQSTASWNLSLSNATAYSRRDVRVQASWSWNTLSEAVQRHSLVERLAFLKTFLSRPALHKKVTVFWVLLFVTGHLL